MRKDFNIFLQSLTIQRLTGHIIKNDISMTDKLPIIVIHSKINLASIWPNDNIF